MADKDKKADSGVGGDEPTKREQREGLREANEAELDTLPVGRADDGLGNEVMTFGPETEYQRAIRVNGDPKEQARAEREREAASDKARARAAKAAKASREENG